MSLSRRLIKSDQVNMEAGSREIPLSPVREKSTADREMGDGAMTCDSKREEELRQARDKMEEKLRDAEHEAEERIRRAEEQAASIRKQARETGYQAGLQKGRKEGYQSGWEEAARKTRETQEQARALLSDAHRETRRYIARTREEIIQLAASMAKGIIRYSVNVREESIVEMAKNALHQAEERKQVLIRCPEQYVSVLEENIREFKKVCPNANFAILEDPSVKNPGCIIETEDQVMDLEIDRQLDNIVNALQEWKEGKG